MAYTVRIAKITDRTFFIISAISQVKKLPTLTLPENSLGNLWLAKCLQYVKMQNYQRPVYRPKVFLGIGQEILYRLLPDNICLGTVVLKNITYIENCFANYFLSGYNDNYIKHSRQKHFLHVPLFPRMQKQLLQLH